MPFLEKLLEIKESTIPNAGMGLFTKRIIAKGSRIVEYKGRIRKWNEAKHDDENFYILFVTNNHVIDARGYKKSYGRYINDARGLKKIKGINNNTEFVRVGLKIFVEATKDIQEGDELLVGYGKEYWDVIRENNRLDKAAKKDKG